jgi:hypothetical protein
LAGDSKRLSAAVYANAFLGTVAAGRNPDSDLLQNVAQNIESITSKLAPTCV